MFFVIWVNQLFKRFNWNDKNIFFVCAVSLIFRAHKPSAADAWVHEVRSCKISFHLRIFSIFLSLRGHFGADALEIHQLTPEPVKGNHHCRMFYPQRPRLFMSFHMKYTCLLQLYVIHTAYATTTSYCKSPWEPITLKPFTFTHNAGVMKMEWQREEGVGEIWALRPSKPRCPSPP